VHGGQHARRLERDELKNKALVVHALVAAYAGGLRVANSEAHGIFHMQLHQTQREAH